MTDCPLCDLSKQEVIYEDDLSYATVILEPLKDGHLMVLPKRHVTELADFKPDEAKAVLGLLGRLEKIMLETYDEHPIIFVNRGKHSTIPHIHFHILPAKGGLRYLFAEYEKVPHRKEATPEELKIIGDKIRDKINQMVGK